MKVNITTIKSWFVTGAKPTQEQFSNTWDSFYHKDEKIPVSRIDKLIELLNNKADKEALNNHIIDQDAHGLAEIRETLKDLKPSTVETIHSTDDPNQNTEAIEFARTTDKLIFYLWQQNDSEELFYFDSVKDGFYSSKPDLNGIEDNLEQINTDHEGKFSGDIVLGDITINVKKGHILDVTGQVNIGIGTDRIGTTAIK